MPCSEEEDGGGSGGGSKADIMYADPKDAVAAKKNFLCNNTLTISKVQLTTGDCGNGVASVDNVLLVLRIYRFGSLKLDMPIDRCIDAN